MDTVCIIEAEYAAPVYSEQMRQEEGEIVPNNFALSVDPNLLPEDADPTGTPKTSFVVGVFAQSILPTHTNSLQQVMHITPHLFWLG